MLKIKKLLKINLIQQVNRFNISTSSKINAGKLWRQSVGLSKLQTARGPLIDMPDYSFLDGRPVPLSVGQVKRIKLQEKLASEVVDGLKYLNQAKELLKNKQNNQK